MFVKQKAKYIHIPKKFPNHYYSVGKKPITSWPDRDSNLRPLVLVQTIIRLSQEQRCIKRMSLVSKTFYLMEQKIQLKLQWKLLFDKQHHQSEKLIAILQASCLINTKVLHLQHNWHNYNLPYL